MTNKSFLYIVCLPLLLLGCGYTVLKEEQKSLPDVKPSSKQIIQDRLLGDLNEYEKLMATGSPHNEAMGAFNNSTNIDKNERLFIVINLHFYNRAVEDTINVYNGEIRYNYRTTPVIIGCNIPPEAIRPISLIDNVDKIDYPVLGHTR